jgi:ABC-2 type transport system ATP-binding protein
VHTLIAEGLRKRYGDLFALDGFDLHVPAGVIHGLLGPNGAGKTTAVKALATLIDFDEGSASVAGFDVRSQAARVRRSIGLVMFGRLYGLTRSAAEVRSIELLDTFGLTEAAHRPAKTYSGGMRRRLDIAAGLILTPAVLFLDEPTTGLDPRGRNEVWTSVREVAGRGTTVLLTTQYLDEADQLASAITVVDHGRVIAEGTPEKLKREVGGDRVTITLRGPVADLADRLGGVADEDDRTITIEVTSGLAAIVRTLDDLGIVPEDLRLRHPTLDEAFLAITEKEAAR